MNVLNEVTNKLNLRNILTVAVVMTIVLVLSKVFISERINEDGEIKRTFKMPNFGNN